MKPIGQAGRDEIVAAIFAVLRAYGYAGASLQEIARATGLQKGSLYHHFPGGKDEMVAQVLDRIEAWLDAHVVAPLRAPGPPEKRVRAMLRELDAFYAGGWEACALGNLVVGESRTRFQARLRAIFTAWTGALADVAVDAGLGKAAARDRAEDAVVRIQGALVLAAALDDPAPFRRALRNVERELLSAGAARGNTL